MIIFFWAKQCICINWNLFLFFLEPVDIHPCLPSPCGPNSQCRENNGLAICSCIPGYLGSPPSCRPECTVNSDCKLSEACSNQKCQNPCLGTCGISAKCQVINHNPICTCVPGYTGDAFSRCQPIRKFFNVVFFFCKSVMTENICVFFFLF